MIIDDVQDYLAVMPTQELKRLAREHQQIANRLMPKANMQFGGVTRRQRFNEVRMHQHYADRMRKEIKRRGRLLQRD